MNDAIPAGEQFALVHCQTDGHGLAVTTGPSGEPLCQSCAVTLARRINRVRKQVKRRTRLAGCATTIKSRNAR